MSRTRLKSKSRKENHSYIGLPHDVVRSSNWRACGGSAIKVLLHLADKYNGFNNGDLSAPLSAKPGGIGSPSTLDRALKELQHYGLIITTRHGGKNLASLYALTWNAIDDCKGKLEVRATRVAPGDWKEARPKFKTMAKKQKAATKSVGTSSGIRSNGPSNVVPLRQIA